MQQTVETSDAQVLDLLRLNGPLAVSDLAVRMRVTATAVRQRLTRLMEQGFIQRESAKAGRGRPSHRYSVTEAGRHHAGNNFDDLALVLWQEVRSIRDPEVRSGLLSRLAKRVAGLYSDRVQASTPAERMQEIANVFGEREVSFVVEGTTDLPVLTAVACPYPSLAEQDRGVCAMENLMLSELVGERVKLSECRLDGSTCCRFETG